MTWKIEIDSSKCAYGADHNTYCCYNDEPCEEENCPIRSNGWPPIQTGNPQETRKYLVRYDEGVGNIKIISNEVIWYDKEFGWPKRFYYKKILGYWHMPGGEK